MSLFKVIAWRRDVDFGPLWQETCQGMLLADSSVGQLCFVVGSSIIRNRIKYLV